jgi:hypothetical protein
LLFFTRGEREGFFFLLPVARKKRRRKSYFVRAIETATGIFLPKPNFYFFFLKFFGFLSPNPGIQNSNQVYMPMNLLALMGGDNKIPAENDMIKSKKKAKPFQPQNKIDDGNKFLP